MGLMRVRYRCQHGLARRDQVVTMLRGAAVELIKRGVVELVTELASTDPRTESRDRPRTSTASPSQPHQPASAGGPGTPTPGLPGPLEGAVPRGHPRGSARADSGGKGGGGSGGRRKE